MCWRTTPQANFEIPGFAPLARPGITIILQSALVDFAGLPCKENFFNVYPWIFMQMH
jgi:hypothetical protein